VVSQSLFYKLHFMSKLSLFFILATFLSSCKDSQNISRNTIHDSNQLKKNQLLGIVKYLSPITGAKKTNAETKKEYYFDINNKIYFIKISEGFITELELSEYVDKQIVIKGEIKNGQLEIDKEGSFASKTESVEGRKGEYITITKILNK
jgi:hypothetical protein